MHGLRMVYAWFTHGLRMAYAMITLFCAWITHGLRMVCAWFTHWRAHFALFAFLFHKFIA